MRIALITFLAAMAFMAAACTQTGNVERGAATGAVLGGVAGAVIGGATGAIIGNQSDKNKKKSYYYWSNGKCLYHYPNGQVVKVSKNYCY